MTEMDELKARVKALEGVVAKILAVDTLKLTRFEKDLAGFEALFDLVRELAKHEGISQEEFQKHYDIRYRHWHDENLRKLEETDPSLAAEVDTRATSEADIPDVIPPLFGSAAPGE